MINETLHVGMRIGNDERDSSDGFRFQSINPSDGTVVATLPESTESDVDLAVSTARAALDGEWSRTGPADRQRMLLNLADLIRANRDELARLDSLEMGMPITRSRNSVDSAAAHLEWYAAMTRTISGRTIENNRPTERFSYTLREPVGVVGAITPWNVPLTMMAWKLGPVIATGSVLVHKPAEYSSLSSLRVSELCLEAGIPAGVVNVITGGRVAGAALAEHLDVDKVAFTGSVKTGQAIIRASAGNIKRLTLELGGKSPNVVFADANLEAAALAAVQSIFGNSGQICTAGSRLLVERSIQDEFVERIREITSSLVVGDPLNQSTDMGPVASQSQLERVLSYIHTGGEQGATLISGGEQLTDGDLREGCFVTPTIFGNVSNEMAIAQEEIFGPVLSVTPFDTIDEAVQSANSTQYGLSGYVWTEKLRTAHEMTQRLKLGTVHVNSSNIDPAVPIGGRKMSGYGKELGSEQLEEYLETKTVWIAQ
ncbi:aldehyde dehydrogenase family protein [Arthrobacter sp. APC 3897]|uniref:aldehyde dehydrogenase family protein n=1 Tax=Arthrobacter sp. APC 3897 TaxID=3035204 RepID=UPI0025B34A47|nr:aldehyde dehydrogenase family protein [Arthrobacter sp. APC 3897]MDN3480647.1 aldehyde dehydrogenase family protein [Arthrobacter sp. APC 3897]